MTTDGIGLRSRRRAGRARHYEIAFYDALGRRIQTIANSSTTRYYYDGWRVLTETDNADTPQRDYAYGNYLDEALLMVDMTGESDVDYYLAHDHLHSPAALLNYAGTVVERYEYDAYGQRRVYDPDSAVERTTSDYTLTVAFTGQRLDLLDSSALPLMYYKNRYYSPTLARFLQRDPLEYVDGANLYEYARSCPLTVFDSTGLLAQCRLTLHGLEPKEPVLSRYRMRVANSQTEMKPFVAMPIERVTYVKNRTRFVKPRNIYSQMVRRDCCCFDSIEIIDHGSGGGWQQFGKGSFAPHHLAGLCPLICKGATLILKGCNVGKEPGFSQLVASLWGACPHIAKVKGCKGPHGYIRIESEENLVYDGLFATETFAYNVWDTCDAGYNVKKRP